MKEKLKSFFLGLSATKISYALILGLVAKSLFVDPSWTASLIIMPVLAFEAYKLHIKSKTPDPIRINSEIQKELDQVKSKLNALTMSQTVTTVKERYF